MEAILKIGELSTDTDTDANNNNTDNDKWWSYRLIFGIAKWAKNHLTFASLFCLCLYIDIEEVVYGLLSDMPLYYDIILVDMENVAC